MKPKAKRTDNYLNVWKLIRLAEEKEPIEYRNLSDKDKKENYFLVDQILGHKIITKSIEPRIEFHVYLISWLGLHDYFNTWEEFANLRCCLDMLDDYHRSCPDITTPYWLVGPRLNPSLPEESIVEDLSRLDLS